MDYLWDVYKEDSLKIQVKILRRGTSQCRNCTASTLLIPKGKDWQKFLQNDECKAELFEFLIEDLENKTTEKPYLTLSTKG